MLFYRVCWASEEIWVWESRVGQKARYAVCIVCVKSHLSCWMSKNILKHAGPHFVEYLGFEVTPECDVHLKCKVGFRNQRWEHETVCQCLRLKRYLLKSLFQSFSCIRLETSNLPLRLPGLRMELRLKRMMRMLRKSKNLMKCWSLTLARSDLVGPWYWAVFELGFQHLHDYYNECIFPECRIIHALQALLR